MSRPISVIASEISAEWGKQKGGVYFGAVPYLEAMHSLNSINDRYIDDSGRSVVAYFLSNARGFRGERAKALKAELNALLKGAR